MEIKVLSFVRDLAREHRVLLLGGHAMIFHGLDRATVDSDVWLDPTVGLPEWCGWLSELVGNQREAYFWDLAERRRCESEEIANVVEDYGVIRIGGLAEPLDVFRRPHNFQEDGFEEAWSLAEAVPHEQARVFSAIDLLASKADTERQKDILDLVHLEGRIRSSYAVALSACVPDEARRLFARYADHITCSAALQNPHPEVRDLAIATLQELADGQNPFAREMLADLGTA